MFSQDRVMESGFREESGREGLAAQNVLIFGN